MVIVRIIIVANSGKREKVAYLEATTLIFVYIFAYRNNYRYIENRKKNFI